MKYALLPTLIAALLFASAMAGMAEPRLNSWFTENSGKYARIYETDADRAAGISKTTWSRGTLSQSAPAYCGVQAIYSSADWVYIRTTGLGSHIMGPWYLGASRTQLFPNLPVNSKTLYRIPRTPTVPAIKTLTGLGAIGYFVDGVAMFDSRDGFYWNGTSETGGPGSGLWNRDAYVNEGVTFDPGNTHQERTGMYHYHANPPALRHLLGDHVGFNPATKTYFENPVNLHHSPILGWVRDGFPIYGPYGFSNPTNANSGVRRMISGFVIRNGQNGTANLAATGRTTLPAWAARAYNRSATLSASEYGPNVSAQYPLGRYLEDNDYLGDLGKVQGADFDLDEYNMRYCVTPDFPNGTYAYFIAIAENGAPVVPYSIGRRFFGAPSGSAVSSISEQVTTNFIGGANVQMRLSPPAVSPGEDTVTLAWSSVEGGSYRVDSSNDLSNWTAIADEIISQGTRTDVTVARGAGAEFYRAVRSGLGTYDP